MTIPGADEAETPFRAPVPSTAGSSASGHLAMCGSTPAAALAHTVQVAVDVLRVDSVGLMLLDEHGTLQAVGFTDDQASVLEATQVLVGQGPGLDTMDTASTVAIADLAVIPAYAALWAGVSGIGLRAVLSCPVRSGGTVVGNLNAARRGPHTWTAGEIREAEAYAKVVGLILDLAAPSGSREDNARPGEDNRTSQEGPEESPETSAEGPQRASRPRGTDEQSAASR
jgi:GAF domain-containing protein